MAISRSHVLLRAFAMFSLLTISTADQFKIRGMAFSSGHDPWGYRQPYADESLRRLKETGTTYVHLTVITGMQNHNATEMYTITDDATTRYIIRKCKRFGFKIFLKPIVQTPYFVWRGFIPGTAYFFDKVYIPYITRIARIAQEEGVEIFSIGSELKRTVEMGTRWRRVIKAVRKVYMGQLTYVANHDSYTRVAFWKALDFISLSAYFKLLKGGDRGPSPNMEETKELWLRKGRSILRWRKEAGLESKKILFAEGGAMSKGQGVVYRAPWDYDIVAPTNFYEQVKIYEGFLNAFMSPTWSLGVILYNWELDPEAGKYMPTIQGYTPQGKPALKVMTKYFSRTY